MFTLSYCVMYGMTVAVTLCVTSFTADGYDNIVGPDCKVSLSSRSYQSMIYIPTDIVHPVHAPFVVVVVLKLLEADEICHNTLLA